MNTDFTEDVIKAFSKIGKDIDEASSEPDIRGRIILHFIRGVLGYSGKEYQDEKRRTDLTIYDENGFRPIVIETKKLSENKNLEKWKSHAFKYADGTTRYVGLTTGVRFMLWEINGKKKDELIADLDFDAILKHKRINIEQLTTNEKTQTLSLSRLTRENIWSTKKYHDFDTYYGEIDIKNAEGFDKLIERLNDIVNNLLMDYTLHAFEEYARGYAEHEAKTKKVEEEKKIVKDNPDMVRRCERRKRELDVEYKRYLDFAGYDAWKKYSGREEANEDENKGVFCRETTYVLLNKLLFIRICEDRGLIKPKISNGGISRVKEILEEPEESYKEILNIAYTGASKLYGHFYELGILDWYHEGNTNLNTILNKVLWLLNRFNFKHVDRDILGKIYEKYLPKEERKKLGEFYTPDEVIDYILDAVGYTPDNEIEGKDILDPACGSGGFLVRAMNRLIERYRKKGLSARETLDNTIDHIYGLDINPFACHIAEMNLLFQIIDIYYEARKEDKEFRLKRFNIYETNSLKLPEAQKELYRFYPGTPGLYIKEQEKIDQIKKKKFDYVVANPPYVRVQRLSYEDKKYYSEVYKSATGNYDIYIPFIEKGIDWLQEKGYLGYICSNRFTKVNSGENIRRYILSQSCVGEYLDFRDTGVFKDVLNYPAIITLQKECRREKNVIRVCKIIGKPSKKTDGELLQDIHRDMNKIREDNYHYKSNFFEIFGYKQGALDATGWYFMPTKEREIFEHITRQGKPLFRLAESEKKDSALFEGLSTGAKKVYVVKLVKKLDKNRVVVHSLQDDRDYEMETDILVPYVEDAGKWCPEHIDLYLLFPYAKEDENYKLITEESFKNTYPLTWNYLSIHKNTLMERKGYDKRGDWYSYSAPRSLKYYGGEKMMVRGFSVNSSVSIDSTKNCFFGPDVYGLRIQKQHTKHILLILSILNSKLTDFFITHVGVIHGGGYYKFEDRFIKQLPVKLPEKNKEEKLVTDITTNINLILTLKNEFNKYKNTSTNFLLLLKNINTTKLSEYPLITFNITSNKIDHIGVRENKIWLNLTDYIDCKSKIVRNYIKIYLTLIKKQLKKSVDIQKEISHLEIPEKEEDIEKIIEEYDNAIRQTEEIPRKIEKIEDKINQEIYELYDLTPDEIKIVEGEKQPCV